MSRTTAELQKQFKRGWYKKGKSLRFLHTLNEMGFMIYQTKTEAIKNSKQFTGINPEFTDWFDKAEYIGFELPEQTKKSS